jgi:hypothetical protein
MLNENLEKMPYHSLNYHFATVKVGLKILIGILSLQMPGKIGVNTNCFRTENVREILQQ